MRTKYTVLALATYALSLFGDNSPLVVQNEYAKEQAQFETQLAAAKKKLRDYESQKEKAIQAAKAQAQNDQEGIAAMKKYWTLILNRYASDDAKFQNWMPIVPKDVENINGLFETYLQSKPLKGRVSAGTADRTLDWGMARLEELAKQHASPKPENNSELEIVTHQIKEVEATIKSINAHADRIGVKLRDKEPEPEMAAAGLGDGLPSGFNAKAPAPSESEEP